MSKKINLPTTLELTKRNSKNPKFYSASWKCNMSKKELTKWLEVMCKLLGLLNVTEPQELLLTLTNIEHHRETQYKEFKNNSNIVNKSKLLLDRAKALK